MSRAMGRATRDAYSPALIELAREKGNIVVLDGDLSKSTRCADFAKEFPERFFNCGIAEANMVGLASGLALAGFVPFVSSFACFLLCKTYDQIRMGITYPEINVKLVGSHSGITVGEDGTSQQSVEDLALATSLPGMTVICPADYASAVELIKEAGKMNGPVFIRTGRGKTPVIYEETDRAFRIGRAVRLLREGDGRGEPRDGGGEDGCDLAIVACGIMVSAALEAAETLADDGIRALVLDMHTIKPIDEEALLSAARTGAVVTAEEHSIWGGLGSAVSMVLSRLAPVPMEFVALNDTYGESGAPEKLLAKYGLTASDIVAAARRVLDRK